MNNVRCKHVGFFGSTCTQAVATNQSPPSDKDLREAWRRQRVYTRSQ